MFGFGDIFCVKAPEHLLVQTTTAENARARIKKIESLETAKIWLHSGGTIMVHGWAKPNKSRRTWLLKEFPVNLN